MVRETKVTFESDGESLVGLLYTPEGEGPRAALVFDGPLTSVKEQAAGAYAKAMAERGFVTLAFDHRFFGESGGRPRQFESPPKKIEDLRHALTFLAARPEVDPRRLGVVDVCAGGGYAAGAVPRHSARSSRQLRQQLRHAIVRRHATLRRAGLRPAHSRADAARTL